MRTATIVTASESVIEVHFPVAADLLRPSTNFFDHLRVAVPTGLGTHGSPYGRSHDQAAVIIKPCDQLDSMVSW